MRPPAKCSIIPRHVYTKGVSGKKFRLFPLYFLAFLLFASAHHGTKESLQSLQPFTQ